jgi:integrase
MATKITKRVVDSKPPGEKDIFVWDSELPGFGLKITPAGRKVYVAQSRVGGKTVRVTIGPHGVFTPEQARLEAKKKLGELAKGIHLNQAERVAKARAVTLGEAYRAYIEGRVLTENTLHDYAKAMRRGFADWVDKPVRDINRSMIEGRFNELSKASQAQANQMFRFLRALLNFAKEKYATDDGEPLIPSNPCDRLTALKRWHRIELRTHHIEPHQLKSWFAALLPSPSDSEHRRAIKDFCAFVLLTGCRDQEAAQLKWTDVNLIAGKVTFRETKNHRTHVLPIGVWLADLLKRRKAEAHSPYIFPADNRTGHLKYHRKGVLAIAKASGVEFRLHDLRRTFASIVNHHLGRSFSEYTIKRLLNHSSGGDVTAGYIQFGAEDLREPMALVEQFVLKCAGFQESAPVIPLKQTIS